MTKLKSTEDSPGSRDCSKSQRPTSDGTDIISKGTEYFRLGRAAEILGCCSEDLVHMGAMGNVEVIAPVIWGGRYEWPVAWDGTPFPEMEPSFYTEFNTADRVILSAFDLAKIEGAGWTVPTFFCAPLKAREVMQNWYGSSFFKSDDLSKFENQSLEIDIVGQQNSAIQPERELTDVDVIAAKSFRSNRDMPNTRHKKKPQHEMDFLKRMSENAVSIPWYAVDPVATYIDDACDAGLDEKEVRRRISEIEKNRIPAEKTTVAHLFIAKAELQRLKSDLPQDEAVLKRNKQMEEFIQNKKPHGGIERFATPRVPVLQAAIYCATQEPELLQNSREWAKRLFQTEARGIWQREGTIPLAESTVEGLLRDAVSGKFTRPGH